MKLEKLGIPRSNLVTFQKAKVKEKIVNPSKITGEEKATFMEGEMEFLISTDETTEDNDFEILKVGKNANFEGRIL
jgi:hypothetical protein